MLPVFERSFPHEQSMVIGIAHALFCSFRQTASPTITGMLYCILILSQVWLPFKFPMYERPLLLQIH